jgi:hypothetical protein
MVGCQLRLTAMAEHIQIPSADDPATALAAVVALRRLADRLERAAVGEAIGQGWTWAQIAEALGVTRQAAHKRHAGRLLDAETTTRRGR